MAIQNIKTLLVSVILFTFNPAQAFEAWWQCSSRQGGDWTFGRAPSICLVDHMQTQDFVKNQYVPILFDDTKPRNSERTRYMTELNALAKEMAQYYLGKRKPSASGAEVAAFTKGLLTLMHQETVWTHYRQSSDSRVRYMRGDSGHGHGLMQVDDRSHQTALLQGKGADLVKNMIYGLDVFFGEWQRAPDAWCLNSPTNWTNRIRSAWAAYNGGPGRICRWTSSSGTFAHHDKQFLDKLNNQSFKNYVTTENKKTILDINCLAEGQRPCPNNGTPGSNPDPVEPTIGELYKVGTSYYCLAGSTNYQCVDRLNDVTCLELRDNRAYPNRGNLTEEQVADKNLQLIDRNKVCLENVDQLFEISQKIELKKRINIRRTPGGEWVGTLPLDTKTQVLDFEVMSRTEQKRYYKVRANGLEGYVYGGNKSSASEWAIKIEDDKGGNSIVASVGDLIEIVAPNGINQRESAGGALIQLIPKGQILEVLDREVRGSQNYIYYQVEYKGEVGFIYSGYLKDEKSIPEWTLVQPQESTLSLKDELNFRFLKQCPESNCGFRNFILPTDSLTVVQSQGAWSEVMSLDGQKRGWIPTADLTR